MATKRINLGDEILVPYGARWLAKQASALAATDQVLNELALETLAAQVRTASGAVPRWHCTRCGKYLARASMKNHARLCRQGRE